MLQPPPPPAATGSCPKCGAAKASMKCDGSGRQQGGIGAVPGFGWWPIMVRWRAAQPHTALSRALPLAVRCASAPLTLRCRRVRTLQAYRPCPALIESGGTYQKCAALASVGARKRSACAAASERAPASRRRKGQDLDEVMFGKNR
jgi:hypothetical protein